MPYVNLHIDLDEFDTDDLVEEVIRRIKSYGRLQVTDDQKKGIRKELSDLGRAVQIDFNGNPNIKTLEDKMKWELISQKWNDITYWQLEKILTA